MYSSQRFKDGILNEEEKFTNESTPVLHGKHPLSLNDSHRKRLSHRKTYTLVLLIMRS